MWPFGRGEIRIPADAGGMAKVLMRSIWRMSGQPAAVGARKWNRPFVSYLRHVSSARTKFASRKVMVLHGASYSTEFGNAEELSAVQARLRWIHYVPTLSRPWNDPAWAGEVG
jgi:NAD(P)H-flavin reductase